MSYESPSRAFPASFPARTLCFPAKLALSFAWDPPTVVIPWSSDCIFCFRWLGRCNERPPPGHLKNRNLFIHVFILICKLQLIYLLPFRSGAGSLRSGCGQGWFFLSAVGRDLLLAPLFGSHMAVSIFMWLSPCMCLCPNIPLLKGRQPFWIRGPLCCVMTFAMTPWPNEVTF